MAGCGYLQWAGKDDSQGKAGQALQFTAKLIFFFLLSGDVSEDKIFFGPPKMLKYEMHCFSFLLSFLMQCLSAFWVVRACFWEHHDFH